MENGERGESRGIAKTARRILVVTSAKQREFSPRILPRQDQASDCAVVHRKNVLWCYHSGACDNFG